MITGTGLSCEQYSLLCSLLLLLGYVFIHFLDHFPIININTNCFLSLSTKLSIKALYL